MSEASSEGWAFQLVVGSVRWEDPKERERYWWLFNECVENGAEQDGVDPTTLRYDLRDFIEYPEDGTVVLFAKGHFAEES